MEKITNESILASDIATMESRFNIDETFQQLKLPSLARVVFREMEVKSVITKIFNIVDKTDGNSENEVALKLVYSTLTIPNAVKPLRTKVTLEALEDFQRMYGDPVPYVAKMLKGISNSRENDDLIKFLKKNAIDDEDLKISDMLNSETQMFEITNRIQQCVLRMNSKSKRTYHAFAIIPYKFAASIMTTYAYTTGLNTVKSNDLLIADLGITKYYVNPDPTDTNCYIGLKHPTNESLSSGYFGSYKTFIQQVDEFETGNKQFHVFNRYDMCMSALHTADDPMLLKFKIGF